MMKHNFWLNMQRVYECLRGYRVDHFYRLYLDTKSWTRFDINQWQLEHLDHILKFAVENVPYYREWAAKNPEVFKIKDPRRRLKKFPVMTKADYKGQIKRFVNDGEAGKYRLNHTGGTGEVFYFYQGSEFLSASWASQRYFDSWTGWKPGQKRASIWGASIEHQKAENLKFSIVNKLYRHLFISTYFLKPDSIKRKISEILKFNPVLIHGYPSSLSTFSSYILEEEVHIPALLAVMSSAETLFHDQRKLIEKAFGVPVFNRYGSREFGTLGMECNNHEGIHLDEIRNYFEFLPIKDDMYEIVVTQLINEAMPLIRYRTFDIARISQDTQHKKCPCGSPFKKVEGIEGRIFDLVYGKDGEIVTGTFWTLLLRSKPGVVKFQVHQVKPDHIKIHLVTSKVYEQKSEGFFKTKIQEQFEKPVRLDFIYEKEIKPQKSGKHRFIISDVGTRRT